MESEIPLKGYSTNSEGANNNRYAKKNSWKRLRRYFRDYCDNSSIIGFKYLGEKRSRGERILWAILILGATILSIYYIMEIYYKYEENPFIVSLATRESPIYMIPFPAITICPVAKSNAADFNYTEIVHRVWDEKNLTKTETENAQYMSLLCDIDDDDFLDYFTYNKTFNAEKFFDTITYLKPTRREQFFFCLYMGESIECNDFFIPIITDEGVCYTFNMLDRKDIFKDNVVHYDDYHKIDFNSTWSVEDGYPKNSGQDVYPRRALLAGADNALQLFITQNINDTDYLCLSEAEGYSVQLHTPYSIPQMKKMYFSVPLDSSTTAQITPNLMTTSAEVKSYRIKDRQCYFSDERYLKYFKIYSPENCRIECLTNYTMDHCGCVNFYMPRDNNTAICGNGNIKCMQKAEKLQREAELDYILGMEPEKGCNCMPLCTQLSYDAETSRASWKWRKQFAAERIEERFSAKGFVNSQHFSRLTIYFKSDQFIPSQRNELYGFFDFLSNFGGLLGLFTGFSLLSAVEVVYFISVRLWYNYKMYGDYSGPPPRTEI
ncbi:pickpocket protein 28-like [Diabrotica undecimpunctata]|uniref:pickpocket protein 28-like n=1 Tax=Diabrotica undecimpunctata TaxID=50387 RepID=UPI003B635B18